MCALHPWIATRDTPARAVQKGRQDESLFFPTQQSLAYLDGSAPGDFGFDPLGLSDPEGAGGFVTPKWLQYGEILNARWAMLGAAGCIAPEVHAPAVLSRDSACLVTSFARRRGLHRA